MHEYIHTYTHIYVDIFVCNLCMHTYIHIDMHTYLHTYTCTHADMYTSMHKHISAWSQLQLSLKTCSASTHQSSCWSGLKIISLHILILLHAWGSEVGHESSLMVRRSTHNECSV